MSRIHDALKRAELERASEATPKPGTRADLARDAILARTVVEERREDKRNLGGRRDLSAEGLSFEALADACANPDWRLDSNVGVFEEGDNGKLAAEAFRTLRSRLYQVAATRPLRKILITSTAPAEGKSFVAASLALGLAKQPNCRVLLVDADLRVGRLNSLLGAPNKIGMTNYLRGEADELSVIQLDRKNGFGFIPAGDRVADPSELILGKRMSKLLDVLGPIFDWVIMDSPPALAVHDASLLADLCDGVLFVVRAGQTAHEDAMKASAEFREKNLLGVVLNQVEKHDFYGSYYYSTVYGTERK